MLVLNGLEYTDPNIIRDNLHLVETLPGTPFTLVAPSFDFSNPLETEFYYAFELDFNPIGENRLSLLADGMKVTTDEGVQTVPESLVTASLHYFRDGEWMFPGNGDYPNYGTDPNPLPDFSEYGFDELTDDILLGIYNDQFPFYQLEADLSLFMDNVYDGAPADERVIVVLSALGVPDESRALVTTGLPNGQRAANWGANWLQEEGEPEPTVEPPDEAELQLQDYYDEYSYEPARMTLDQFASNSNVGVTSTPYYAYGDTTDEWVSTFTAPDSGTFSGFGGGTNGTAGWLDTITSTVVDGFFSAAAHLTGKPGKAAFLSGLNSIEDAKNIHAGLEAGFNGRLDELQALIDGEVDDVDIDKSGKAALKDVLSKYPIVGPIIEGMFQKTVISLEATFDEPFRLNLMIPNAGEQVVSPNEFSQQRLLGTQQDDAIGGGAYVDKIYGGAGDDVLEGNGGNDRIYGGDGNDQLKGGGDYDRLYGGDGIDTALFSKEIANYQITRDADGNVTSVEDLDYDIIDYEWLDDLEDIERLVFADSKPAPSASDFDANGHDDILFFNEALRGVGQFQMPLGSWSGIGKAGVGWEARGTGLFDGDDTSTDILWFNVNTRSVGRFDMENGTVAAWSGLGRAGQGWEVQGSGDFNGDGTDDILWINTTTRSVGQYRMDEGVSHWQGIGKTGAAWEFAGIGDFDGDASDDILWWNASSRELGQFRMIDGTPIWSTITTLDAGYKVAQTGDFNGDGADDILVFNENTRAVAMFDAQEWSDGWVSFGAAGNGWSIAGTGDFDANGADDVLWRHEDGRMGQYVMENADFTWDSIGYAGSAWDVLL